MWCYQLHPETLLTGSVVHMWHFLLQNFYVCQIIFWSNTALAVTLATSAQQLFLVNGWLTLFCYLSLQIWLAIYCHRIRQGFWVAHLALGHCSEREW